MNIFKKVAVCAAVFLLAAGCSSITLAPAGTVALGGSYKGQLQRPWSDISALSPTRNKSVRILTQNGPLLDDLYLAQGLASGEGLTRQLSKQVRVPTFAADMSGSELVEFVADSVAAMGYEQVETTSLRKGVWGRADAIRFDLTAKTKAGLDFQGTAEIAKIGGKAYLVLYLAAAEHYYPNSLPDVEALIASAA